MTKRTQTLTSLIFRFEEPADPAAAAAIPSGSSCSEVLPSKKRILHDRRQNRRRIISYSKQRRYNGTDGEKSDEDKDEET